MPTPEQAQARGFSTPASPGKATDPSRTSRTSRTAQEPRLLIDQPEPLLLHAPLGYHLGKALGHSGLIDLPPIVYSDANGVPTLQAVLYPPAAGFGAAGTPPAIEVLVVQPIPASDQPLLVYGLRPSPLTDALADALTDALLGQLRTMLRLDDDLGVFYKLTEQDPELSWVAPCDGGRLLRAPTAFEDLVQCLVLAYAPRAEAAAILQRLCDELGPRTTLGRHGFPSAAELAAAPALKYEQLVGRPRRKPGPSGKTHGSRLGRSLRELALCCATGSLYPESLRRQPSALTPVLELDDNAWQDAMHEELEWQERVRALLEDLPGYRHYGVGPRAIEEMMLRLGCYDGLRLDLATRAAWEQRFARRPKSRRPAPRPTTRQARHAHGLLVARRIARRLSPFSIYRGLAQALLLRAAADPAAQQ